MRTEGSRLLAATGLDHATIAAELGVTRQAVQQWIAGDKSPSAAKRALARKVYGVPLKAWDAPLVTVKAPAAAPPSDLARVDAEGRLRAQLARLDSLRSEGRDLPPQARLRLEATETRCIELLSRLTGEGQEIGESRIVRLPAWRRIQDTIVEALRPHPEAAVAVMAALKEFGS